MIQTASSIKENHPDWHWFYVTFGLNHIEPSSGESLFRRFVLICAPSYESARDLVTFRLHNRYSMLYTASEFVNQMDKYGLTEWLWSFTDIEIEHMERQVA